jgi:hypothetical protein
MSEMSGKGKLVTSKQIEYEGDFANGKKHGVGIEKFPDGRVYEGEFFEDLKEGFGIMNFNQNSNIKRYIGFWKNNVCEGNG